MARRKHQGDRKKPQRKRFSNGRPDERRNKRELAVRSSAESLVEQTPEQLRAVERLLSGIGVPEPKAFVPDDFQVEALKAIETQDVLVTASSRLFLRSSGRPLEKRFRCGFFRSP